MGRAQRVTRTGHTGPSCLSLLHVRESATAWELNSVPGLRSGKGPLSLETLAAVLVEEETAFLRSWDQGYPQDLVESLNLMAYPPPWPSGPRKNHKLSKRKEGFNCKTRICTVLSRRASQKQRGWVPKPMCSHQYL